MQAVGPVRRLRLLRRRRVDVPLLGGLRPPVAVLLLSLVSVSVLASHRFGISEDQAVSGAIIDSQGDIAVDSARSPGAGSNWPPQQSCITRLCAGALRGGGLTTVARTTGTADLLADIGPDPGDNDL